MGENIHEGHRDRVKDDFLNGKYNSTTPDYKWLELLLFYSISRKDTNPLAHKLINKYKTLSNILEAPAEELMKFEGLTKNSVVLLKMIIPLARQYELQKNKSLYDCLHPDNINDYIFSQFYGLTVERMGVALVSPTGKLIDFEFLSEGDLSIVGISARAVIKYAFEHNASCLVIAHNHPNSFALPSGTDIETTKMLSRILNDVNIRLLDHIIIAGNDYISMAQSSKYTDIFN